jgi:putative aldouronate transport system substrate-binding protein
MRRFATAAAAMLLMIGMLAGCASPSTSPTATPAGTKTPGDTPAAQTNEFGWAIPEQTLEFTYYLCEQGDPVKIAETTVHMDEFLKDKFNVVIHKLVYDTDPTERLNLMLATGDYPDAVVGASRDQLAMFVAQNKAVDMKDLVDQYGDNIKSQLGDLYIRYFDDSGKLFMLPKYWGLLPIPDYAASIRYDYWLEAGSPKFSTPYEFYDVLVKLQQAHPTNENGQPTYALSDMLGAKSTSMIRMLTGAWGFKDQYMEAADHTLTHWMNTDKGLEIAKFVNKIYRDGQMDPDFLTNQFEQFKEKVSSNRIMGYIGSWWPCWTAGHMVWQKTDPNWTKEEAFINVSFKDANAEKAYLSPKDLTGLQFAFITNNAKAPADIVKWWNFEITDLGTKIICLGIPDSPYSDWHLVDGKSIWNDGVLEQWETGSFDLAPYDNQENGCQYWMVAGQQLLSNGDPRTDPWCDAWFDQNFNSVMYLKKILHENLKDTTFDSSYRAVTFAPENPLTLANTQINDLLLTGWGTMVTAASEEDCVKEFNNLRDQLNAAGLKDIEKFRTEEYINKLDKWGGK